MKEMQCNVLCSIVNQPLMYQSCVRVLAGMVVFMIVVLYNYFHSVCFLITVWNLKISSYNSWRGQSAGKDYEKQPEGNKKYGVIVDVVGQSDYAKI